MPEVWASAQQYADYYRVFLKLDRQRFLNWMERENPKLHAQVVERLKKMKLLPE